MLMSGEVPRVGEIPTLMENGTGKLFLVGRHLKTILFQTAQVDYSWWGGTGRLFSVQVDYSWGGVGTERKVSTAAEIFIERRQGFVNTAFKINKKRLGRSES